MSRLSMCADLINDSEGNGYSILDVGCRGKELKALLTNIGRYQGIDLEVSDEVIAHDLEYPIPMEGESFDVAVALDVVEHVENSHQLVSELLRISGKKVIISLPNMYHWRFRINVLLGRDIGGKYKFPTQPIKDRHRWVTSYNSSKDFILANSSGYDVKILPIIIERKFNKPFQLLDFLGAKFFPNLFAYGGMYVLTKKVT